MGLHLDDAGPTPPQLVLVDRVYELAGPRGTVRLADLFEDRSQLVVYHVVLDPARCEDTGVAALVLDCLSRLLPSRQTAFAVVVSGPLRRPGSPSAWYSCRGDFTADFHPDPGDGWAATAVSLFRRDDDGRVYHARAGGGLLHRIGGFGLSA